MKFYIFCNYLYNNNQQELEVVPYDLIDFNPNTLTL